MVSTLVLIYFGRSTGNTIKINFIRLHRSIGNTIKINFIRLQTVDLQICLVLIFLKGSEARLLYHILYFWRKIFLILNFINWPNFIIWLSLLLEILGNICIVVICCPVCNFEINCSFLRSISDAVLTWGLPEFLHLVRFRLTNKTFFRSARTSRTERL